MNFFLKILSLFSPNEEQKGTGAFREEIPDRRNINLGSFQKPVGAADMKDVRGLETLIIKLNKFFDQKSTGSCVAQSIVMLMILYIYRKTGKVVNLSARWLYKLCKMIDGLSQSGTYPRIGALAAVKDGFLTEDLLKDNASEGEKKFLDFEVTEEMRKKAKEITMPGFAWVDPTIEAIKEAIFQNGAVVGATVVGKNGWNKLPLLSRLFNSSHYTIWYRVEDVLENGKDDHRVYVMNSWGSKWLEKIKNWLFPGRGYFLWSEYDDDEKVFDIIAFTDIPADILEKTKVRPYRFSRNLKKGMIGTDVLELQKFLNSEGFIIALDGQGSKGKETNYFGQLTMEQVIQWQEEHNIPATGYFGEISRAEANKRVPGMDLEEVIIEVESGGNDKAIGDRNLVHQAYGAMQIRQPLVDDVNRFLKTSYRAQDCLGNRDLSLKMWDTYFKIYPELKTDEDKAKAWNGGAGWKTLYGRKGYEKYTKNLDIYWSKVKKLLDTK